MKEHNWSRDLPFTLHVNTKQCARPDIVSKALKDVSTLGKPTGTGEDISASTPLVLGIKRGPFEAGNCLAIS